MKIKKYIYRNKNNHKLEIWFQRDGVWISVKRQNPFICFPVTGDDDEYRDWLTSAIREDKWPRPGDHPNMFDHIKLIAEFEEEDKPIEFVRKVINP